MKKKNGKHRHSFIDSIVMVFSMYKELGKLITAFKIDTYQTGRNLLTLSIMLLALSCFFMSTWLCLSAILFFYLMSLQFSTLSSLFFVCLVNLIFLLSITYKILHFKNHLFYPTITRLLSYCKQKN